MGETQSPLRIVPPSPTAHTLFALLPHRAFRLAVVPLLLALHVEPFRCRSTPWPPAAHRSLLAVPHTARRGWVVPVVAYSV
jgi:hypothetical protein